MRVVQVASAGVEVGDKRRLVGEGERALVQGIAAHRLLVANNALAGELDEARAALQGLKRLVPDHTLKSLESVIYVRDDDRRRYFDAFRMVGLE